MKPFVDIFALRHADSAKWMRYPPDVLALWVADMDFEIAPSIREALIERLDHPIGYHLFDDPALRQLLGKKLEGIGLVGLPGKGIDFLAGVVQGLFGAVTGLTAPGDDVLTMTPIYPPFLSAISSFGRHARPAPLNVSEEGWRIDWEAMEKGVTASTRLLMLCHPHNPTGRVWNREELAKLAEFVQRHGLFVVSDELHADLILDGEFVPFAAVASREVQMRTITLTGPCKTYNTAGLGIGAMISHEPELIARVKNSIRGIAGHASAMSYAMWRAALVDNGVWLNGVMAILRSNREMLRRFISERLPGVRFHPPQATYLAWLDFREHPRAATIQEFLLERGKVALNPGTDFGVGYEGFVRLNFATSPEILMDALERIVAAAGTA